MTLTSTHDTTTVRAPRLPLRAAPGLKEEMLRRTGTTKLPDATRMAFVFAYSALPHLAAALERADATRTKSDLGNNRRKRGARPHYPLVALLATAICAKVAGSTAAVLTQLTAGENYLWQGLREVFFKAHGTWLPSAPPRREHMRYFYERFIDADVAAASIEEFSDAFTTSSVKLAQYLGNLRPDIEPDWSSYDATHTVFGDGMIAKRYSDVYLVPLPDGTVVAVNSRAGSSEKARVQDETRGAHDKKAQAGINFVCLQTRTGAGRVVLAVASTVDSEQWATLKACDRVAQAAAGGFHTLVYDRLVTGWLVRYLMAEHGIQTEGKVTAPGTKKEAADDTDDQIIDGQFPTPGKATRSLNLPERIATLAAERGLPVSTLTKPILRQDVLKRIFDGDRLAPVGTCIYPTTSGYDVVRGYCFTETATHTRSTGESCTHDLVIDDGALYTYALDDYGDALVKTALLPCVSAVRYRSDTSGGWARASSYTVPCTGGDFTYVRDWVPETTRYQAKDARTRTTVDPVGWRLHPIPRADTKEFAKVMRDRNDSESYNAWYQRTLPGLRRERGVSPYRLRQELDFLLGAVLANAETWAFRP